MIPFFQWLTIPLGPLQIQVWGLFVALGLFVGLQFSLWAAKKRGLEKEIVMDAALWIIFSSLVGARLIYLVTEWETAAFTRIIDLFAIWNGGMSISGGFLGALFAAFFFLRYKKVAFLPYADVLIFGLPVGLWIGRLGCFFIFDHPGRETTFFLGQMYLDGVVRHNHGLYLSLNGLFLTILFLFLWHRIARPRIGMYLAVFGVVYGGVRFFLDFFRATDLAAVDSRFFGLTFAQYLSVVCIVAGVALWYAISRKHSERKE